MAATFVLTRFTAPLRGGLSSEAGGDVHRGSRCFTSGGPVVKRNEIAMMA